MISSSGNRRRSRLAAAAAAFFLLSGCAAEAPAKMLENPPTRSAPPSATPAPATTAPQVQTPTTAPELPVLPESRPDSFRIPSTGATSDLLSLGLRDNGSLEVPPDGPGAPASWYNGSPTPGERGPAVLLGHVNATDGGPGIFAELRKLKAGDTIEVTREDGTKAVFTFDRGEQYAKDAFPTEKVYGNTEGAELRLITCDGFDPETGEFDDNYVVYAKLVG
ncbi:class F sortase [Arthrobacter zhaoguopingii]|uniref:class F sortase n=1 Tax=Arthrobacter zhaoguopingii TaxID=2681491 RepID=UPI0013582925|nr:class F sortase [Arthrobacter zhaoguopingii]